MKMTPTRNIIRFGPNDELFGVLHLPDSSLITHHSSLPGMLFCPPFGEEAKNAYRVYHDLALRMAERGWAALRFDYYGTGNSLGSFDEFSPARACSDIRSAIGILQQHGVTRIGLLGLGLGATLAFEIAVNELSSYRVSELPNNPPAEKPAALPPQLNNSTTQQLTNYLVLWQPIVSGEEFYKLNVRQQLFRQKLIRKKTSEVQSPESKVPSPQPPALSPQPIIDLDGYPVRKQTAEEIRKLNLVPAGASARTAIPATLLLQISFSQTMAADLQALIDSCNPPPQTQCIVGEPFWKRLGAVDCSAVMEATMGWVDGVK